MARGQTSSRQIRARQIGPLADWVANWAPHFFGAQFATFGKLGPGKSGPRKLGSLKMLVWQVEPWQIGPLF